MNPAEVKRRCFTWLDMAYNFCQLMSKYYYIKIIMHIALNLSYETKLRLWLVATKNGSSCKEAGH